ncbi:MAG: 4'-phosphopantetheinyl transferase superfamily protein [Spirochaetota bacterium]|nr:4'-phosphopantetheinyl transferase superfamily protein [Spirochaetota bacterium]
MRDFNNIKNDLREQNVNLSLVDISNTRMRMEKYGNRAYSGLLTDWEHAYVDGMRYPKRKYDFLSGRLAAKRAVKGYLLDYFRDSCESLRFNDIEIRRLKTGKPEVSITNNQAGFLISISHSGTLAVSTVSGDANYRGIGVDIERIEKRDESFLNVAFNQSEINRLKVYEQDDISDSISSMDKEVTRSWVIKEAVLKSLGLGLNMDLKDIEILDSNSGRVSISMTNDVKRKYDQLHFDESDLMIESFIINNSYVISIACLGRR